MIEATDLKNGTTFLSDGRPHKVLKYSHVKMGRGGAIVRVSSQNLETGSIEEKTFSSNAKVEEVLTLKRKLQFLYADAEMAVFMDPNTYEQVEISMSVVREELRYIKEGEEVNVLFWSLGDTQGKDRPLSMEVSAKATLTVVDAPPGVKGNSATNIYKLATLENGIKLKVPLFIDKGDRVVVDTRTGEYVERVKSSK